MATPSAQFSLILRVKSNREVARAVAEEAERAGAVRPLGDTAELTVS